MDPVASREIWIAKRFCGPPDSGNGGFTCGLTAEALPDFRAGAEATLRKPIPIEKQLTLAPRGRGVALLDGNELVIEAIRATIHANLPHTVSFAEATQVARTSPAFANHPFPTCFVCGPKRPPGDGLRIFPGRIRDEEIFAAPWIPAKEFADKDSNVRPEIIWAALDCPTGFAGGFPYEGKLVTGRLGVTIVASVKAGQQHVLVSWRTGNEARKAFASAALLNAYGAVCAYAQATWIRLQ